MYKQEFYNRLEAAFQPEDYDDLAGLWEHLGEQIDSMEQEGLTLEAIIDALGSPEDIAREFYLDINIQTAIDAESSVIPAERAGEISRLKKRLALINRVEKIGTATLRLLGVCIWAVAAYCAAYLLRELAAEGRLAPGPLVCLLSAGICALARRGGRRRAAALLACGLGVGAIGLLILHSTNVLFYRGHNISRSWNIGGPVGNISISGNVPLDIIIEQGGDGTASLRLDGAATRSIEALIDRLEHSGGIDIALYDSALFGLFTATPDLHLVISVPAAPEGISIRAGSANALLEGQGGSIDIELDEGHVVLNDTRDARVRLAVGGGDAIVQRQQGCDVSISCGSGRIILKNNDDISTDIQSEECFIRMQDTRSEETAISNSSGKTVLENSSCGALRAESGSGDIVGISMSGDAAIQTQTGGLVLKYLEGSLDVNNANGSTIVVQHAPLNASVDSEDGLIRWEQREGDAVEFRISGGNAANINQFEDEQGVHPLGGSKQAVVRLSSREGAVKVFREDRSAR